MGGAPPDTTGIKLLFFCGFHACAPSFFFNYLPCRWRLFVSRKARDRMAELSQTRGGTSERWGFTANGLKEEVEAEGTGGGGGKQLHRAPPSSFSSLMDSISGEFALVVNGHSLVPKPSM